MTNLSALESGTELAGDFRIDRVIGAGGFGVTYLAREIALDRLVTIKEYFPGDFAQRVNGLDAGPRSQASASDFQWGLDRFVEEAQTLAKFDHPNIVRVYRTFKANNTAYMVLHFEEGQNLKAWLKGLGRSPRQKELDRIVAPLLDALETIHRADFLHRDIAPDNIIIRTSGEPVLIDFGAARGDIAAHSKTKTVSALVKPGYSPYEQYAETSRQQGAWTDIYALAATLYHAITGKRPPDSPSRMLKDELVPAAAAALGSYRSTFLAAIDRGLALAIDARPQSIAAWRGALLAPEPKKPGFLARMREPADAVAGQTPSAAGNREKIGATIVPPPPDAPGPAGGLLDFVDELKGTHAAKPATVKTPPAKAAREKSSPAPAAKAAKAAQDNLPVAAIAAAPAGGRTPKRDVKAAKKRPAPAPDVARKRRWTRGLTAKLSLAAALSGVMFAYRDDLPRLLVAPQQSSTITTGAIAPPDTERKLTVAASFRAHDGPVEAVKLSGDGRLIVTIANDRVLKIWNRDTQSAAGAIYMDDGPATSLSVRNNRALTTHTDGSTNLWDLDKRARLYRFKRNDASVWAASFAGSEDSIAAGSHDWTVALWETSSEAAPSKLLEGHENAVQSVATDPSGAWLATGSADKSVKLWSLETRELKRTYRNHADFVTALAFSADSAMIAAGSLDGSIRIWPVSGSRALRTFNAHKARVTSVAFSANGELLASAAEDGSVRVRGLKHARPYWTLSSMQHGAVSLAFDAEGRQLVTGGKDGTVTLWALPEPALAQR